MVALIFQNTSLKKVQRVWLEYENVTGAKYCLLIYDFIFFTWSRI